MNSAKLTSLLLYRNKLKAFIVKTEQCFLSKTKKYMFKFPCDLFQTSYIIYF